MSSNLRLKRICEHCGKIFTAKTTVTKFCSDPCAKANYKLRQRQSSIDRSQEETREKVITVPEGSKHPGVETDQKEFVDIKSLAALTSIGERTLYRLVKEKDFPKLKIGSRLLFHKETVFKYLIDKYSI